jgi:hypothetical protein
MALRGWEAVKTFVRRAAGGRRVLLVDHIPVAIAGAGSPRAAEFQRAIVAAGASLTLLPEAGQELQGAAARSTLPGRELALGYGVAGVNRFLAEHRGRFDVIIVSRPDKMAAFRAATAGHPELIGPAAVIYDAEALFAEREVLERQVRGRPLPAVEAERRVRAEIELAHGARMVLAVSEGVAGVFRAAGNPDVRVLGHAIAPRTGREKFSQRQDILFVGPTYHDNSPNTDAVVWFVDHVLPLVRQGLGRDVALELAGICRARTIAERGDGRVKIHGPVPDLATMYGRARVFVAPTRFASGLPLKLYDTAAHGVPAVVTPLLARQVGWSDEQEVLVAETPAQFAAACLRLYNDESLWTRVRSHALQRVAHDCDPGRFDRIVAEALSDAASPWRGQ